MKRNRLFLGLLMTVFSVLLSAQTNLRQFATQSVQKRLKQENPTMAAQQATIEQQIRRTIVNTQESKVIPLVFHIVTPDSSPTPLVSAAQLNSQINALNQYFNMGVTMNEHPADEQEGFMNKQATNLNISFCLADGGISHTASSVATWGTDDAIKSSTTHGATPLNTATHLNIWIADLADQISGYAQMPGGPTATDGIVIDYEFLGTEGTALAPYDEGKTLVHLIGNYLGLYDLWSEDFPCSDDMLRQTPVHNAMNTGCPTYKHISVCTSYPVEMTMNYMDNTNDACMYMFTQDQMYRMHCILADARSNLVTNGETNCNGGSWSDLIEDRSPLQEENKPILHINMTPNPAQTLVNIAIKNTTQQPTTLVIYNTAGQLIHHQIITATPEQKVELSTKHWQTGIYFVHAHNGIETTVSRLSITQ